MARHLLIALSVVINFSFAVINGQLGIVGAPCYSSGTCFGYTTCMQNRCACMTGYQQMGQSCVQMGVAGGYGLGPVGAGYGGPYGGFGGCLPGMPGCGVGIGGIGGAMMPYPGQACGGTYGGCGGGAFCQSGICCCPTGFIQSFSTCVPGAFGPGFGLGPGMGYGFGGLGGLSGLSGLGFGGLGFGGLNGLMYGFPGQSCMGISSCGGGAFCQSGMCVCPHNWLYTSSVCVPMPGLGLGGLGMYPMMQQVVGGYGGTVGFGFGTSQVTMTINVGGYCQYQSMTSHCIMGASCVQNTCRCMGEFYAQGTLCIRRRLRKDPKENINEQGEEKPKDNVQFPQVINTTSPTASNIISNWLTKS